MEVTHTPTEIAAMIEWLEEESEWTNQRPYFHAHYKSLEAAAMLREIAAERDAEIERLKAANGILEDALQEVGDDYPGSSCQEWCRQQVKHARAALKEPSHDEG